MCHQANEDRAWNCRRCGYEFGQPIDKTLELLRGQQRSQRILVVLMLVLLVAIVGTFALTWLLVPWFVMIAASATNAIWLARTYHKLALTRASIRSLSAQQLPEATAVR
jgi:hypothetical protein